MATDRRWHDALTLGDLLVRAAERDPRAPAIVFPDARSTYGELEAGAVAAARSLAALGVGNGSHVGILMPNCIDFLHTFFGAALLGAVAVPINARFKPRELGHVIADGDLEVLVTSDLIEEHVDYVALLHETLAGLEAAPDPLALDLRAVPRLRTVVLLGGGAPGMVDRRTFAALADATPAEAIDERRSRVAMRQVALMMYTSGTTAMPKGCPLSHEALVRTSVIAGRTRFGFTAQDRFWDPLPMFHMSAILPLIGVMDAGAAFLSMTHFEPDAALAMLDAEGATVSFATFPAVTQALLNHPGYHPDRWRRIRLINNVAPPDSMRAMQAQMPHTIQISAYGCTECAGVVAFNEPTDTAEQRATTCGRPFDGIELGIRDLETGAPVGTGDAGRDRRARVQPVRGLLQGPRADRGADRRRRLVPHRRHRRARRRTGASATSGAPRTCSRWAARTSRRWRSSRSSAPTPRCRSPPSSASRTPSTWRCRPPSSSCGPAGTSAPTS